MTVTKAKNNFIKAAEIYVEALMNSSDGNQMLGEALGGFVDGWANRECKFTYEENEYYNIGYGTGVNHLIP